MSAQLLPDSFSKSIGDGSTDSMAARHLETLISSSFHIPGQMEAKPESRAHIYGGH